MNKETAIAALFVTMILLVICGFVVASGLGWLLATGWNMFSPRFMADPIVITWWQAAIGIFGLRLLITYLKS